jgi:hypothetical protein
MVLVVTDTNTLLVYERTRLLWSAQLVITPVCVRRATFEVIKSSTEKMVCVLYEYWKQQNYVINTTNLIHTLLSFLFKFKASICFWHHLPIFRRRYTNAVLVSVVCGDRCGLFSGTAHIYNSKIAYIICVPSYTEELMGWQVFKDLLTTMQIYSVYWHSLIDFWITFRVECDMNCN